MTFSTLSSVKLQVKIVSVPILTSLSDIITPEIHYFEMQKLIMRYTIKKHIVCYTFIFQQLINFLTIFQFSVHTEYIELDRVSVESIAVIRRHVTFVHRIISRVFPAEGKFKH